MNQKEYNRRLLVLADFLDKLPADRFDFAVYVDTDWEGKADLSCGTTACALGWATTIPEFQELGLRLFRDVLGYGYVGLSGIYECSSMPYRNAINASREIFGTTEDDFSRLFVPGSESYLDPNSRLDDDATAAEVAENIRAYVSEH